MGKEITHFKGGRYKILEISLFCIVNDEDLDSSIVFTYQSIGEEEVDYLEIYTRPFSELFEIVNFTKGFSSITSITSFRFTLEENGGEK